MAELSIKFERAPDKEKVENIVKGILDFEAPGLYTIDNLKKIFGLIDLTSLNVNDTTARLLAMCKKVNEFHTFPRYVGTPNVAAVCVYPVFVAEAKNALNAKTVKVAAVAGGFPASQTFPEIKVAEAKLATAQGADEIDIVMNVRRFLEQDYQAVYREIATIKDAIGGVHLKVILETGILDTPQDIKLASFIAMEAGADFIKTSTGKIPQGASPEAVYVMAEAAKEFYARRNRKVGIKPAGGISTAEKAIQYLAILKLQLGKEWLYPDLFRFGASSLANNLLSEIIRLQNGKEYENAYFD